ncbi:gamma-aminobutyric acid receptor subunit beta-like isoform X2 [Lineus longissimus]|uniref:gamma-aminobutyric acid receptor subunit beta-like isoform X2 n=1 Tax=Lineus longissimus TaxID=88925 RepID=UPI00315C6F25
MDKAQVALRSLLVFLLIFWPGRTSANKPAEKVLEGTVRLDTISFADETSYATAKRQAAEAEKYKDENSRNVSLLLDSFLEGYDKRLRPNYRGPPVEVNVSMWVQSVSSISEVDMDFTLDMYFRQTWTDPRLRFTEINEELSISADMLQKIWWPDTFFANAKSAQFHTATTKNAFLRISPQGNVLNSLRLTVTAGCPMDLTYFPMDSQKCSLEIESFGYTTKDIIYFWAKDKSPVGIASDVQLPQFKVQGHNEIERLIILSTGNYSRLACELFFERSMGYYLIQIYIPSTLIVVLSWVSFWLSRGAVPARVALGITTVLTMTTLISSTNASLPKISYLKSIDVYLVTCFVMVFASLLEYAAVSYIAKRCAQAAADAKKAAALAAAASGNKPPTQSQPTCDGIPPDQRTIPVSRTFTADDLNNGSLWRRKHSNPELRHSFPTEIRLSSVRTNSNYHAECTLLPQPPPGVMTPSDSFESEATRHHKLPHCRECCSVRPSTIDKYSRIFFPLVFICFNIMYWVTYLYISVATDDKRKPT